MTKKKIAFIQEYVRDAYVGHTAKGEVVNVFNRSQDGRFVKSLLELAKHARGITEDFTYESFYAFPEVPIAIKVNTRDLNLSIYQPPTLLQLKEHKEQLHQKIHDYDPDVIITMGGLASKSFLGVGSIAQARNRKSMVEVQGKEYPTFATYGPAYVLSNPNMKTVTQSDFETALSYLVNGEQSLVKNTNVYTTLYNTDVDKILALIKLAKAHATTPENAVAFDYETNSLSGTAEDSKIITVSMSFKPGTGITFPLDHPTSPLAPDDRERVVSALLDLFSYDAYLIGHNVSFDEAQTKTVLGPVQFKNTIDTLVGVYILISQEAEVPKGLKQMAMQYTDLGEYDNALDEFKSWFNEGFNSVRGAKLKATYKKTFVEKVALALNDEYELTADDYLPFLDEQDYAVVYQTAVRLLDKFGDPKEIRNEQDGSDKSDYSWIPYRVLADYASGDVNATIQLHHRFLKQLETNKELYDLYVSHYPALINTTTNIQSLGIALDVDYLSELNRVFTAELERIYDEMMATEAVKGAVRYKNDLYAKGLMEKAKAPKERDANLYKYYTKYKNEEDREFSPTDKTDLHYALFSNKDMWLPMEDTYLTPATVKKLRNHQILEDDITFMDWKTDKTTLEALVEAHPEQTFASLYQAYGRLAKLNSTYTTSLIEKADSKGMIHGQYLVTGTDTTRLSSKNPNMQNIAKATNNPDAFDYEYPIKNAFVTNPHKGQDTIVNLDFSSQEAHLAAVVGHDEGMIEAFLQGKDIHAETAALMYDIPVEDVTRDQRQSAKSVTFGLMYGKTPMGYAKDAGITKEEAEEVFEKYFKSKPKIKEAIERAQQEAERTAGIRIPASGFIRKLGNVNSNQYSKQQQAMRQSFNTVIQGSSAFLTQKALIALDEFLRDSDINADIIMTVHDSITLSVAHDDVVRTIKEAKYIMEHVPLPMLHIEHNGEQILFPMEVSADVGATYGYEFEYDEEDFLSFKSTKGFTEYYKLIKKAEDMADAKKITKEQLSAMLERLEEMKSQYQLMG